MNDEGSGWGFSHLASMPIPLSLGAVLLLVLIVLVAMRFLFADVSVKGGVR